MKANVSKLVFEWTYGGFKYRYWISPGRGRGAYSSTPTISVHRKNSDAKVKGT